MAPTLFTPCNALPPKGALAPWGGPTALNMAPTLFTVYAAQPPNGAFAPCAGPAELGS